MHILPYSWWCAYSRNFGRDDGNLNANALATGPSATTFCQNMMTARFPRISHHILRRKLKDMAGDGLPPCSWYSIQTGDDGLGRLNCSLATCHKLVKAFAGRSKITDMNINSPPYETMRTQFRKTLFLNTDPKV
jgi:hypothetical protein